MVVAEPTDIKKWKTIGVRQLMRKSGLSQKAVYAILAGEPVRAQTFDCVQTCCRRLEYSEPGLSHLAKKFGYALELS